MFYFCFLSVVSVTSSSDTAAEPCPRSTSPTKSDLPSIVIFCIVASAGTSLSVLYVLSDLTLPFPSLPPAPLREKQSNKQLLERTVFFLVIGSILIYFYVRQMRERTKRNEHREKVWQFRDMQRSGQRPTLKADGKGGKGGGAPIQISHPVLMSEATTNPRYPDKSFYW
jgi:hypothetical protein